MNELDEIRRKLEDYSLDGYNVNSGWDKLQQRKGRGRYRIIKMIAGVAAACVVLVAGYCFLKQEYNEPKHHKVTVSGIEVQKQREPIIADTVTKSMNSANEIRALQKTSNHLTRHREKAPVITQELQAAKEKPVAPNEQTLIREKDVNIEKAPVIIAQRESPNNKPLEIVSEEKLLAMVSAVVKTEPKQSKLKHFFISRGEQQEYTTEKYSSDQPMFQPEIFNTMKSKSIVIAISLLVLGLQLNAQKTYWEMPADLFEKEGAKGITLDLGGTNKLVVYAHDAQTIDNGVDFKSILQSFFDNYDVIKDSVNAYISNKVLYYYNPGGKNGLTVIPGAETGKALSVVDGKAYRVKRTMDTINIYPRKPKTINEAAVFSFRVNQIEDLRAYITSDLINDFIKKVDQEIQEERTTGKNSGGKQGQPNMVGLASRYKGTFRIVNNQIEGDIVPENRKMNNLSFSVSADLQNFKSYMAPSFNTSIDLYFKGQGYRRILRLALYWEPVFLFDKGPDDKLKTYRNDFVGFLYEYRRGSVSPDKLSFYAPFSASYLVKRRGDFFEKNTFRLGIGGIKYGAATVRPFMYFNSFFKDVTPGVQLSVGWGR
ncbi:hypothetical protein [Niabella hibiscisoli]|uniref:hypothetical protein n=1 Tax=Niabella hibiscisoli TaxID=1825928 RepID=UPI001F0D19D0|nr:hypothetical protein [Niabella hibiscisoli]MCH5717345.1 hypothetical protein [Niabella hibiscisoli]